MQDDRPLANLPTIRWVLSVIAAVLMAYFGPKNIHRGAFGRAFARPQHRLFERLLGF